MGRVLVTATFSPRSHFPTFEFNGWIRDGPYHLELALLLQM